MTIHHNQQAYESLIVTGDWGHGLTVADLLAFAERLLAEQVPLDVTILSNDFLRPQPIHGLQVLRETTSPWKPHV